MTQFRLKRFNTLAKYQETDIPDGTFFVIVETGQLGVRKGDKDVLTPPNTLRDYESLAEGDALITQNETVAKAIAILEQKLLNSCDNIEEINNKADLAIESIKNLNSGENTKLEVRITSLENRIEIISEEEFELKEGFDRNRIYYIYEND